MIDSFKRVLTIAGSDSGGGAGIQADLKTLSALGCFGMSAITALTAQNTLGVKGIEKIPAEFVKAQMDSVLGDLGADAIKIGMLFSIDVIQIVSDTLHQYPINNIVLDPVMYAKSGDLLIEENAIDAMRNNLIPQARVLTPNLMEASKLLGKTIKSSEEMEKAARELSSLGPIAVVIKGGDLTDNNSNDCLYIKDKDGTGNILWFNQKRIETKNINGTGCTFSSAITAFLAKSFSIDLAVGRAKEYITNALLASRNLTLGAGHGPLDHFYHFHK